MLMALHKTDSSGATSPLISMQSAKATSQWVLKTPSPFISKATGSYFKETLRLGHHPGCFFLDHFLISHTAHIPTPPVAASSSLRQSK